MKILFEKSKLVLEKSAALLKWAGVATTFSSAMAIIAKLTGGTDLSVLQCLMPTYVHGVFLGVILTVLGTIKLVEENNIGQRRY